MISGEDESSSVLNGRLRPRKSTANITNSPNKSTYKPENKVAQDKQKRNSILSKASLPNKQDDLTAKADSPHLTQLLCPYCDRKFTTKLSATKHARRIHLSTSKQDNFINCLICNHSEAVGSDIIRHMVDSHPNQYFACLDCNTRFLSTSELAEHKLNICEKQKQAYRSKLRQKASSGSKKAQKKLGTDVKNQYSSENKELKIEPEFNGVVISCELKPTHASDVIDIEDNITTNLILPSNIGNTVLENNAVLILDDMQWKRRMPPNFSFRNADADQILSRLGVVHRSPRVGESTRREWLKMIDVTNQKFEKCFDTNFYSRVASNVQQNLARFLDGSFNFSPDPDKIIKTRKSKSSAIINTAEGFPILLPPEQYSRNRFDGYMPRAIAPKHKWKWDCTENEKNIIIDASVMKRDNHVDNCIITLVSSLDMWTQLRMRRKFEGIFCKMATEKTEKQNIIGRELKEILESREIPSSSTQVVEYRSSTMDTKTDATKHASDFPSFLGLSARPSREEESMKPAVLSGEWVRPRCYVCCACGDQTRDARALTAHMAALHPNAQVQHYEIVGESLLNADILKHLYVPPSQMPNRTRPLRGFRDCTKCKTSVTMDDLHQHMLDCAGDTPAVRRKCRSRPFGVRRRRPRLSDNTVRKNIRKDLRTRHNQKALLRTRPRIRTEVGDAETIRKMIADLPAKRHRQAAGNINAHKILRPRRKLDQQRNKFKIKRLTSKDCKTRKVQVKKDLTDLAITDEDDQPLITKSKIELAKTPAKKRTSSRVAASKNKNRSSACKDNPITNEHASTSQPQQISNVNVNQRFNATATGYNEKDGEDRKEAENKSPNEKRDKDNHKSVAADATLLKHSINNITASNKALQLQQQCKLPQEISESSLRDTQHIFLENDVGSSLPDKPPLQTNQRRSSQKKRESLLNCIEKIKSQHRGESTTFQQKHTDSMRLNEIHNYHTYSPFIDPHPAVISGNCNKSGPAENLVPAKITGIQDVTGAMYQAERGVNYPWGSRSEAQAQRTPIEVLMMAPAVKSLYAPKSSEPTSVNTTVTSAQKRRKSTNMHPPIPYNELTNQLPPLFFPYAVPLYLSHPSGFSSAAHMQQRVLLEQSQRMSNPELMLQHQQVEIYPNNLPAQYNNQTCFGTGQYNITDLPYDVLRNYVPPHNEIVPPIGTNQQSPDVLSISPKSWMNESLPYYQSNNNHTLLRMVPSTLTNERMVMTTRRESRKKYSESSEPDIYGNRQFIEDSDMLNYANMRSMPPETANTVTSISAQRVRKLSQNSHNDVLYSKAHTNKNNNSPTITRNEYNSDMYRSVENENDTMSKVSEHYQTVENQSTAVNSQHFGDNPSTPELEMNSSDSDIVNKETGPSEIMIQDRFDGEHSLVSSRPSKKHEAKRTPPPIESTVRKSIDTYNCDQIDLPLTNANRSDLYYEDHQKTNSTAFSFTEEPLDLCIKNTSVICKQNSMSVAYVASDQTHYGTEKESNKNSHVDYLNIKDCDLTVEVDSTDDNATNLSYKKSSQSISTSPNKYINEQQAQSVIDRNSAVENLMHPSCKKSPFAYHKELSEVKTMCYPNNNKENDIGSTEVPNTFSTQLSNSLGPEESVTHTNSNHYFKDNVDLLNRLSVPNEMSETTVTSKMLSNNILYQAQNNAESLQKNTPNKLDISSHHLRTAEQQKDLDFSENKQFESEATESSFETTYGDNYKVKKIFEKIATLPLELTVFVKTVLAEEKPGLIQKMYDSLVQPDRYGTVHDLLMCLSSLITSCNPQLVSDKNIMTTENSLTVNTAVLPTSSILPKKRHSPSTRLNSQNTAQTFLTPSHHNSISGSDLKNKISSLNDQTEDKKENVEVYECKANTVINKIIDLTDDLDDSETKTKSKTMLIQESVQKPHTISKNYNEKTASLRAVRIKTPLARKSISDDKLVVTKEVYNHHSICVDSQQRELNIRQLCNSDCDYGELPIDSASASIPVDSANIITTQLETTTTVENQLASETSNFIGMVEREHKEPLEITPNDSVKGDEIINRKENTVMQQLISDNDVEEKSDTLIFHKDNECCKNAEAIARKNIENDTFLDIDETSFDAARGCSPNKNIDVDAEFNPTPCVSVQSNNSIPVVSNSICVEQLQSSVKKNPSLKAYDTQESKKGIESSTLEQNSSENMIQKTNSSTNVNSPDSISLKEKQAQSRSLGKEARCASVMTKKRVSKRPKNKIDANTQEFQNIFGSTDSTFSKKGPKIELKMDETKNNYEVKFDDENYKTCDFEHSEEVKTVDNFSKQAALENSKLENSQQTTVPYVENFEHNKKVGTTDNLSKRATLENSRLDNSQNTPVPYAKNVNNERHVPQINNKRYLHMEFSQSHLNKNSSDDQTVFKPKNEENKQKTIKSIKSTIKRISNDETQLEWNEIKTDSYEETSSAQSFNTDSTLIDEYTIDVPKTSTAVQSHLSDTDAFSAAENGTKKMEHSKRIQSVCLSDSISTNLEKTEEYALRRSRRRKSINFDSKDANDQDTIDAVVIDETVSDKIIPVTKKQLIFSKLLLDENSQNKIDHGVISDVSLETKISPDKRKKKPGKTKSKKKKLSMKYNDKNNVKFTFDSNNKTLADKKTSHPNITKDKHSFDSETKLVSNEDQTDVLLEENGPIAKRTKLKSKKDITLKQQDVLITNNLKMESNNPKKTVGNGKFSELSPVKQNEMPVANQVAGSTGYNGFKQEPEKAKSGFETKTACYNRAIFSNQLMSSTTIAVANPENYDPYDINLDMDMAETTRPIAKRKTNKPVSGTNKNLKLCSNYAITDEKNLHKTIIEKPVNAIPNISLTSVSDSDSSISDEPLQKYVIEKEKLKNETFTLVGTSQDTIDLSELESTSANKNVNVNNDGKGLLISSKDKIDISNTDCIMSSGKYKTSVTVDIDQRVNQTENIIEPSTIKSKNTKKRNCRSAKPNISPNLSSETNQELTPDKCMENFGFFSKRQPRKSNLLATKKITETYNSMIESDDSYFRPKERQKKSAHNENRKTVDGNRTSKSTQEATVGNNDEANSITLADSTLQESWTSTTSKKSPTVSIKSTAQEVGTTSIARKIPIATAKAIEDETSGIAGNDPIATAKTIEQEPDDQDSLIPAQSIARQEAVASDIDGVLCTANNDGEVDLITAQIMLESEEIRKLERDLYSGFKEAAEANAGRTSGFNQLRVEEAVPHEDVFTPIHNEAELEVSKKPEKLDNEAEPEVNKKPKELKNTKVSDKPDVLENKYDIIKRRQDAKIIAKQAALAKKAADAAAAAAAETPSTSKTEKPKKKSGKKRKKSRKKPSHGSQVPTKGALKGFDGVKISIPTQDLNMPPNLSPPQNRQRQSRSIKPKDAMAKIRVKSGSSHKSDTDTDLKKIAGTSDIYEFQDEEKSVSKGYNKLTRVIDKHRSSSSESEERTVIANRVEKTKKKRKNSVDVCVTADNQQYDEPQTKRWKGKGKGKGKHAHNETNKQVDTTTEDVNIDQKEKQSEYTEKKQSKDIDEKQNEYTEEKQNEDTEKKQSEDTEEKQSEDTEEKQSEDTEEKQSEDTERSIDKSSDKSKTEQCMDYLRDEEDDDGPFNDYNKTLRSPQSIVDPFNFSDTEDQIPMPGTSGFVPDRNDESSFDSDSSYPISKVPYECTCRKENELGDNTTKKGCSYSACRHNHLNAAKNVVMEKIFKNNALRTQSNDNDKFDDLRKEVEVACSEPKPDWNYLFDSLFIDTDRNPTSTRSNIPSTPGPSSATHRSHVNINPIERDTSNVDDGFSSPNHRDCERATKIVPNSTSRTSPNRVDDEFTNMRDGETLIPHDDELLHTSIQAGELMQPEVVDQTSNESRGPVSSDSPRSKHNRHGERNRNSQTKRSAPLSDDATSSGEDETSVAKLRRKKRKANKKHRSHTKRNSNRKHNNDSENTASSNLQSSTYNALVENETEQPSDERISPSRVSDEGISTSHDNSADAYDIATAEHTGVAVQRARRKCTVGKQNVLVEQWSTSESETEIKGRKTKKGRRTAKKERTGRRSREFDSDKNIEAGTSRVPLPKVRGRAATAIRDDCSDTEPKKPKLRGWIVGDSPKLLVSLIVSSKRKSRGHDNDTDETDEEVEERANAAQEEETGAAQEQEVSAAQEEEVSAAHEEEVGDEREAENQDNRE